jgi:hypothetical protein
MELAEEALLALAAKLTDLLNNEYVKQEGLRRDIKALAKDFVKMHADLLHVSQMLVPEVDKDWWVGRVLEVAYGINNVIDTFVPLTRRRRPAAADLNVFKKMGRKATDIAKNFKGRRQLKDMNNLSKELLDLCWYILSLCSRYSRLNNTAAANSTASQGMDLRRFNMYKTEAELVGIEEPRDEIIRRLTDGGSEKTLKIVSIAGFGGLGKTAVAKTVHDRLKKQFDCSAFVSVGRDPRITGVLEELLEKLDKDKYSDIDTTRWDDRRFIDELRKFLQDRRSVILAYDFLYMIPYYCALKPFLHSTLYNVLLCCFVYIMVLPSAQSAD